MSTVLVSDRFENVQKVIYVKLGLSCFLISKWKKDNSWELWSFMYSKSDSRVIMQKLEGGKRKNDSDISGGVYLGYRIC